MKHWVGDWTWRAGNHPDIADSAFERGELSFGRKRLRQSPPAQYYSADEAKARQHQHLDLIECLQIREKVNQRWVPVSRAPAGASWRHHGSAGILPACFGPERF